MENKQLDSLLRSEMQAGFARVDERFAQFDERFKKVDERFAQIDERFTKVDERFDRVDERLSSLEHSVEQLRRDFRRLERRVEESAEETRRHFDVVSERNHSLIQLMVEQLRGERGERLGLEGRVERLEESEVVTRNRLARLEQRTL